MFGLIISAFGVGFSTVFMFIVFKDYIKLFFNILDKKNKYFSNYQNDTLIKESNLIN